MLKIVWLFGVFVTCAITGSLGVDLTGPEVTDIFPNTEDIAFDRASPEQWELLKNLANDHDLSVGEAIAAVRDASRQQHNRLEGKPPADATTARAFCADLGKAPRGLESKTPTRIHTLITELRGHCDRYGWH